MGFTNIEIKAKCKDPSRIRNYLQSKNAEFKGTDHQTDTYFNVPTGRLKLREGNIENNLIYYERGNESGPKDSNFSLVKIEDPSSLKQILTRTLGIKIVVEKIREIYYISNVKFHIDIVPGLGDFMEIEAGNILAPLEVAELKSQCEYYQKELGIHEEDLISCSYSDLLLEKAI